LYFIAPTGHSLKPLDIELMKRLSGRVNLIPVIAKADTLTAEEMQQFKARVRLIEIRRVCTHLADPGRHQDARNQDFHAAYV
jgi:cell division control protein 12